MESTYSYIAKLSAEQILNDLAQPAAQPGSIVYELYLATLQVRIAEMQRETARDAMSWARLSAISTFVATVIALVALLIATLHR